MQQAARRWPRVAREMFLPASSRRLPGSLGPRIGFACSPSALSCTAAPQIFCLATKIHPAYFHKKLPLRFLSLGKTFSGRFSSVAEEILTHSAEETIAWGREFAKRLRAPLMILLPGDLGSGKTTLTKGIVSGLGAAPEEDVTSPTFTLLHVYGAEGSPQKVFHGDLYRIEKFHDFETLGMEDIFAAPSVVILEWSERFPLPSPWPQLKPRFCCRRTPLLLRWLKPLRHPHAHGNTIFSCDRNASHRAWQLQPHAADEFARHRRGQYSSRCVSKPALLAALARLHFRSDSPKRQQTISPRH